MKGPWNVAPTAPKERVVTDLGGPDAVIARPLGGGDLAADDA
jgi:hypothetical protein